MPPVLNARLRFLVLAHAIANRESIAVMTGACRRRQLGHLDALFNRPCEGAAVRRPPEQDNLPGHPPPLFQLLPKHFTLTLRRSRSLRWQDTREPSHARAHFTALPSLAIAAAIATGRSLASSWNGRRHTVPLSTDRCVRDAHCVRPSPYSLIWIMRGSRRTPPRRRERPPSTQQRPPHHPNLGRNAAFRPAAAISAATCGRVCGCAALRSHT